MQRHHEKAEEIDVQSRNTEGYSIDVSVKECKDNLRIKENNQPADKKIRCSAYCRKTDALFDAGKKPCAVIKGNNRLGGIGETVHG